MKVFIVYLSLMVGGIGLAQDVEGEASKSGNPLMQVIEFIDRVSSSEEHLIHKTRVGPYLVNADGQRLVEHPYLKFSITEDGKAISQDTLVTVDSKLYVYQQDTLELTYTTVPDGKYFVIDPLNLQPLIDSENGNDGWFEFDLNIDNGTTVESRTFALEYYPPRPEIGPLFSIISTLLPIVLLGIIVVLFRSMRLNRNQVLLEST